MNDQFDSVDELDDEGPQSVDLDEFGYESESDTLPCPSCGCEVYEDADRCPACGEYISPRWAQTSNQSTWLLAAAVIAIAAIAYYFIGC